MMLVVRLSFMTFIILRGFIGGSDGKESACYAGGPSSIPRSERSPGEGNGNPFHILGWRTSWTEESGSVQSIGSHRAGHK